VCFWSLNSSVFSDEDLAAADHLLHGRSLSEARTNVVRSSEGGDDGSTTSQSVVSLESHNDAERPSTSLTVQGGEHLCQI